MLGSRHFRCALAAPVVALALMALASCQSSRTPSQPQGVVVPPAEITVPPAPPGQPVPPVQTEINLGGPLFPGAPQHPAVNALTPDQRPKVALLLPLTGSNSDVGNSLLNAAQLALFDFSDQNFQLLVEDDHGTADGAADAARRAVAGGAALILGPLLSGSVKAVAPVAQGAGVNVIAFSSDRAAAQPGIFVMGFLPELEVNRVVEYARSRGLMRFAALAPDTAYGNTVLDAFRQAASQQGSMVVQTRTYSPTTADFAGVARDLARFDSRRASLEAQKAELRKRDDDVSKRALERLERRDSVGDPPFDALLLADGGKRLQALAAQLPAYDIDPARVRMLGTGQWDVSGLGTEPALFGGWYAAPDPKGREDFTQRFREAYGKAPERIATLAYDAVALACVLAQSPGGADFRTAAITAPEGFQGRDGIFRFLSSGQVQRGLAVLELQRRDAKVVDPAPDAFRDYGS